MTQFFEWVDCFQNAVQEMLFGHRAFDDRGFVDHRAGHRVDLILRGEVRKLGGLDAVSADVVIFESEAVGQAYRPRAVRSSRGDKHLEVDGLGHLAQLLLRLST
jgi:hypothetical protein